MQVVGEMGFFFGMRYITHAKAAPSGPVTLFALPKTDFSQLTKLYPDQEEQITKNILQSWDHQHFMQVCRLLGHQRRLMKFTYAMSGSIRRQLSAPKLMLRMPA